MPSTSSTTHRHQGQGTIKQDKHDEPADVGACAAPCDRVCASLRLRGRVMAPARLPGNSAEHDLWSKSFSRQAIDRFILRRPCNYGIGKSVKLT